MFLRKMMEMQLSEVGLRLGDSCTIQPFQGHKRAFTLNRHCIDLISRDFKPAGLCMSFFELPNSRAAPFHYRLELDEGKGEDRRFILKTLVGGPFWLNGSATKEAFIERSDRLCLDENRVHFDSCGLKELSERSFDHAVLGMDNLIKSELNILIVGETGTGKTDLARKIHDKSGRAGQFVSVNLASFNPQLIESELFGHKKGSFTGAITDRKGAFEESDFGTLFLDEVDSLPVDVQTKLLTFIDQKRFRPVGASKEREIKSRLLFASGTKLENLVESGKFRRDFYYRLKSGHSLELSSLRNSPERIKSACQFFGMKNQISFSERLIDFYQTLAWPGNLRQLFGHLEKKRVLGKGSKLDFDHVDEELILQSSDLVSLSEQEEITPMEETKLIHLKRAFTICEGNVAMTARKLQLSEKTVRTMISKIS